MEYANVLDMVRMCRGYGDPDSCLVAGQDGVVASSDLHVATHAIRHVGKPKCKNTDDYPHVLPGSGRSSLVDRRAVRKKYRMTGLGAYPRARWLWRRSVQLRQLQPFPCVCAGNDDCSVVAWPDPPQWLDNVDWP